MLNKRGQVGETMTWLVASVAIIAILFVGIYFSGLAGGVKNLFGKRGDYLISTDKLAEISLHSYLLTEKSGEKIYSVLMQEEELNDENGEFAKKVFERYEDNYDRIWFGINYGGVGERSNDYFGTRFSQSFVTDVLPGISVNSDYANYLRLILKTGAGWYLHKDIPYLQEAVYLGQGKIVELILKRGQLIR